MANKLALENLTVESFEPAPGTEDGGDGIMNHTYEDPCFSADRNCTFPCVEPSGRTNLVYCCG